MQVSVEACRDDTQQQAPARGGGDPGFTGFDQAIGGQVRQAQGPRGVPEPGVRLSEVICPRQADN